MYKFVAAKILFVVQKIFIYYKQVLLIKCTRYGGGVDRTIKMIESKQIFLMAIK